MIAEVDVRGSRECAVHISVHDGRSWFRGGDVHVRPFIDCSIGSERDPHVIPFVDRDGVLYLATTAKRLQGPGRVIRSGGSTNLGL